MFGKKVTQGSFPYSDDGTLAPYTDGVLVGTNLDTSVYMPAPAAGVPVPVPVSKRGYMTDYIGNTTCVDANTWATGVFAGDS